MSGRARSKPYDRQAFATTAGAGAEWRHDLFMKSSDLYSPAINHGPSAVSGPAPSPSLAPFGGHTPALHSDSVPRQPRTAPASNGTSKRQGRAALKTGLSLLDRIQGAPKGGGSVASAPGGSLMARISGGAFGSAAVVSPPPASKARLAAGGVGPQRTKPRPSAERRADLIPASSAPRSVLATPPPTSMKGRAAPLAEPRPSLVVIKNLAEGTTAEDVEAAFHEFGEIVSCDMDPANEDGAPGRKLAAHVAFKLLADAERAVARLHNALADGARLSVTISSDSRDQATRDRAAQAKLQPAPGGDAGSVSVPPARSRPAPRGAITAPPPSRMLADVVEQCDPRASVIKQPPYYRHDDADAMDTDEPVAPPPPNYPAPPTGPRADRESRHRHEAPKRASGGGRGPRPQRTAAPSLLERMGAPVGVRR